MEVFCIHSGSGDCNAGTLHLLWIATEIWAVVHLYHCEKHHHSVRDLVSRTVCCQCLACIWYLCRQTAGGSFQSGMGISLFLHGLLHLCSWVTMARPSKVCSCNDYWILNQPLNHFVLEQLLRCRDSSCNFLISNFGSWYCTDIEGRPLEYWLGRLF